jgi:hypothetical protein
MPSIAHLATYPLKSGAPSHPSAASFLGLTAKQRTPLIINYGIAVLIDGPCRIRRSGNAIQRMEYQLLG